MDEHHRRYVPILETEARQDQIRRDAEAAQEQAEEEFRREEEEREAAEEEQSGKRRRTMKRSLRRVALRWIVCVTTNCCWICRRRSGVLAREKQRRELRVKFDKVVHG